VKSSEETVVLKVGIEMKT